MGEDQDRSRGYNSRQRFEQWIKNPRCEANVLSAVLGKGMHEVAAHLNVPVSRGQSPFAIAHGRSFERHLFDKNGERLLGGLRDAGIVPSKADIEFVDIRQRRDGGVKRINDIDDALAETREHLLSVARATHPASWYLLVGATVKIPGSEVMLPEALLIIDALVMRPTDDLRYSCAIGEIKTYPDRGGFSDKLDIGAARAQAGIYVHALEAVITDLGLKERFTVERKGFLVLSKPGSYFPSVRANEDLRYMAERANYGFKKLRVVAEARRALRDADAIAAIESAPISYEQDCLSFCDLAPHCRRKAEESGLAAVLGEEMVRFLRGITLHRAFELVDGNSPPANEVERDFVDLYTAAKAQSRRP